MSTIKWYHASGKDGDIVISTRVRLARNLKDYPFPSRMTKEQLSCVNSAVKDACEKSLNNEFKAVTMSALSQAERTSLAERHLISPEFAQFNDEHTVLINEDESVCIMLCEEDHIRIQVMSAGFSPEEAFATADRIDTMLDSELHFAFDEKLGYLTECPTNLGTGMRASVMLHLPAIEAGNGIENLGKAVGKIGLTLRGTFGEGSGAAGALYQLSNQITLGIDEKSAIQNLSAIAVQVIEQEKKSRKTLDASRVEDMVWRSLGILKSARLISTDEMLKHISNLRLGVSMGFIDCVSIEKLNTINNDLQSGGIICEHPEAAAPGIRDKFRAEMIRNILE